MMKPEEQINLLPCPFCGSDKFLDNTWTSLGFGVVICSKCEAEGPHTKDNHICEAQAKEAIQLWNTRTSSAALEQAVVEAAVKLNEQVDCFCFEDAFDISSARAGCELLKAVDALIAARESNTEAK